MSEKLLVKDRHGKVDVAESLQPVVQSALQLLSASQLDRYYRASKVFFIMKTSTFEFEDSSV